MALLSSIHAVDQSEVCRMVNCKATNKHFLISSFQSKLENSHRKYQILLDLEDH